MPLAQSREPCPQCGEPLPAESPRGLCPACLMLAGLDDAQFREAPTSDHVSPAAAGDEGNETELPSRAQLADRFPQLEIIRMLGKGGMGAVYLARQTSLDRLVALKILPPKLKEDAAFADRFTREAKAMARLTHPNIVVIYEFGQADGLYYLLMEYVDGVNLRQAIRGGDVAPKQALAIVAQICDALQFAHDEGIVHRDIKPENVLLDHRARVKIADFGLAKLLKRSSVEITLTGTQQVMGTLHYMAPEQLERPAEVDHRADIYSLGVVFYELLTGQLPLGRFELPSRRVSVDARLDDIVLKSLEREPDARYQHASEIKTAVEDTGRHEAPLVSLARVASEIKGEAESVAGEVAARFSASDSNVQTHELVKNKVDSIATALSIVAWLMIPLALVMLVAAIVLAMISKSYAADTSVWMSILPVIPVALFACIAVPIILIAASRLRMTSSRWLGMIASVLVMLPLSLTCLIGIPIGIWSLLRLSRRDVIEAFAEHEVDATVARQQCSKAGTWLVVCGILSLVLCVVLGIAGVSSLIVSPPPDDQTWRLISLEMTVFITASLAIFVLQIIGARHLAKQTSVRWSWFAATVALLPISFGWPISFPVGLYAIAVLMQRVAGSETASGLFVSRTPSKPQPVLRPQQEMSEFEAASIRRSAQGPATGLLVVGILNILFFVAVVLLAVSSVRYFSITPEGPNNQRPDAAITVEDQR